MVFSELYIIQTISAYALLVSRLACTVLGPRPFPKRQSILILKKKVIFFLITLMHHTYPDAEDPLRRSIRNSKQTICVPFPKKNCSLPTLPPNSSSIPRTRVLATPSKSLPFGKYEVMSDQPFYDANSLPLEFINPRSLSLDIGGHTIHIATAVRDVCYVCKFQTDFRGPIPQVPVMKSF